MNENETNDIELREDLTQLQNGDLVSSPECATWQNRFLRWHGYPVYSSAWNLIGVVPVFNGYENTTKPENYDKDTYLTQGLTAANNI